MIIAFLTVGTMGLSNTSLGYLNYPTQVIFKCCKLIPVMLGGVFIQGTVIICFVLFEARSCVVASGIRKKVNVHNTVFEHSRHCDSKASYKNRVS